MAAQESGGGAAREPAAFTVDGRDYPRRLFDLRVQAEVNKSGRDIQALRHPGALRRYQQGVLLRLIESEVVAADARRLGLTPSAEVLERALSNPAPRGVSADEWRREVERDAIVNAWVLDQFDDVQITDEEIAAALQGADRPQSSERALTRHILLQTADVAEGQRQAQALLEQLNQGVSFAELASSRSADGSAAQGGLLGWVVPGQMVPEFDAAVFGAVPGQPVGPVHTQFGTHVVLVEKREAARPLTDAEWRAQVQRILAARRLASQVQQRIDALKAAANIEIYGGVRP